MKSQEGVRKKQPEIKPWGTPTSRTRKRTSEGNREKIGGADGVLQVKGWGLQVGEECSTVPNAAKSS